MTTILGISGFYHDSAAAVLVDGQIVAAAQEERFSRIKHDHRFPRHAVQYCLSKAGVGPRDLDYVGFYEKPLLKFDRILKTYLAFVPWGFRSFCRAMPLWMGTKLHLVRELDHHLKGYHKRYIFPEHHESHAASAFFPSPFDKAAIMTLDGVGEWATASWGVGQGRCITLSQQLNFPHSLGLLYSAFTYYCGFRVNFGEYKLMGLAPYGQPQYSELILTKLLDLKTDGSFRMDMSYFNYCQGLTMTSDKFHHLFGGPPRKPSEPLTEKEMDLAASVQKVTEQVMLCAAWYINSRTRCKNLCLGGGVALNCVGNGRLLREGPFDNIWIQPAAGDAGGALGVALFIWHQLLGNQRQPVKQDLQQGSLLGPSFTNGQIKSFLDSQNARYRWFAEQTSLCDHVAELLDLGKVVGWFQGRMEFGPRALGGRSILGDARRPDMQSRINRKIKFRESFRPLAPSVLLERASDYFDVRAGLHCPYMVLVAPVREDRRLAVDGNAHGLQMLCQVRSEIPAVTHVDYSARIQTVDQYRHELFHSLLKAFEARTGCPVLINTSFNVHGKPIVCTPPQAYESFLMTEMDALVLGAAVLNKIE